MAPVGIMGDTKLTTTTSNNTNNTSNKEFKDSNNNEELSNSNNNTNLLVISNEAYPTDETSNGTDGSNKHTVNSNKGRKINESNNNNNNSYCDLNDEHNSCGLQDQLTLDSENTMNDFASSSSISVSSLSPLSDVNNNHNSNSNNNNNGNELKSPAELLTAAEESISETSDKLKSHSKEGDDVGAESASKNERNEEELSTHVKTPEPTSITGTTTKTQIAAPNSLALHTNLNSSLSSNPIVSSESTTCADGLSNSAATTTDNQTFINNKQSPSVYVPIISSPSSSNHINIPYINQPMLPPAFTPVANYGEYQHQNGAGLHYQGFGILLQPPLAGPSSASTPDGSIPGPAAPGTIYVHVDAGHVFQVQLGDEIREIVGPATVRMMSSNDGSQPMPIQLTTPSPGQIVQQIVDENGTHLILSSQQQHTSSNPIPYNTNDIDPSLVNGQQPPTEQYQLNAQSPTYYPSPGIAPHQYPIQAQPNQQQHHTLLPHPFQQHAQLHSPHHFHHYQPPPHHFQVQPQPSQYLSSLAPSPAQSPKPTNNININTNNLASSPVNDSNNTLRNKNPTTGTNIVSLSPSSSSSCSSTSHTSILSNDFTNFNKSANKAQHNQFLSNTGPPQTAKNQHKEPKSFRKYNATSNNTDFSLNNSSNKTYFSNIPFSNYQVINSSHHNKGPKNKAFNPNQLLGHPNSKKYQFNSQYVNGQYSNMVELQHQQQELVDSSNDMSNKANKNQSLHSKEEQGQLHQDLQKYFELYKMILTNIKKPYVCDIEAQSVLVRLSPIELDSFLSSRKKADTDEALNINQTHENGSSFVPKSSSASTNINYEEIISRCENVNYTLELANETNVFNKVYTGDANEITLKDLKPNTKYFLRVFASLSHKCRGDYTSVITFQTKPCEPDQPNPPKQVGARKKNEMTFRWTTVNDNGSKVLNYILQCREAEYGDSVDFREVYRGPLKQFIVKKLTPSTSYAFRLAAENSLGVSEFSPVVILTTQGSVPNVPAAPVLVGSTVSTLTLSWDNNNGMNGNNYVADMEYELQMLDIEDKIASLHGYLTVCNGPIPSYTVVNLKQSSVYQFRLRCKNEEGYSGWSEAIKFKTKANVPKNPHKLRIKIQQNQSVNIKVTWDSPTDNGGDKISAYQLELSDSLEQKKFESIFEGNQLEYLIEQDLIPGATYYTRVSCSNSIGCSEYSDIVSFITPSARPGKCLPPKLLNKAKPNSLQVKWSYPETDGGSPITAYELVNLGFDRDEAATMATDKHEIVYKGPELSSVVNDLLSGRIYFLKVRAINEIGTGDWSDLSEISTGAGPPDTPDMPSVTSKSTNCLVIFWPEPHTNGAPILEYRLEMSQKRNDCFIPLYNGPNTRYECKGQHVQPSTRYFYRVQALNVHGSSAFSKSAEFVTQASAPSAILSIKLEELTSNSMSVSWKQPNSNGCPVVSYNIDLTEINQQASNSYIVVNNKQSNCEYKLDSLMPDTIYKLRIQACNSIGAGHFSNIIKIKTKALPPTPPNLECVSTNYNSIKLKWNHVPASSFSNGRNFDSVITSSSKMVSSNALAENETLYNLEMMSDKATWIQVYQGPNNFFKVSKLQEFRTYAFRLSAINETGQGEWSSIFKSRTTKSPPVITKSPLVLDVDTNSCHVTWQPAKITNVKSSSFEDCQDEDEDDDQLEYCLQMQVAKKDAEYRDVYKGPETWCNIMYGLEPGTEYNVRVCAIRLQSSTASKRLCSAFTPNTQFTTQKSSPKADRSKQGKPSKTATSSKLTSNLSRFIWPSFYLNMNSSESMTNLKHADSVDSRQTSKYSKKSSLTKNASNSSHSNNDNSSNSHINHNSSDSKLASGKQMSDQQWALFFILILVMIAFFIAFVVNSLYTSYYEVNQTKTDL